MKRFLIISTMCNGDVQHDERYYFEPFAQACIDSNDEHEEPLEVLVFDVSTYPIISKMGITISQKGLVEGWIHAYKYHAPGQYSQCVVQLSDVDVAWYLRPGKPPLSEINVDDPVARAFAVKEIDGSLDVLWSLLYQQRCRWVNAREPQRLVMFNKGLQYAAAAKSGMLVPQTFFGLDPKVVADMAAERNGVIMKPITTGECTDNTFIYTNYFTLQEVADATFQDSLGTFPVCAQEPIPKRVEHRVMVVGDEVYSCQIDSQACPETSLDWRHYGPHYDNVVHSCVELPSSEKDALKRTMIELNLRFAAIDLIETPDGRHFLVDINPAGQWEGHWGLLALHMGNDQLIKQIPLSVARMIRQLC